MRKDKPEIIPFPIAERNASYDASGNDHPSEPLIPFYPPIPSSSRHSPRADGLVKSMREEGLKRIHTLEEGLECFLSQREEPSQREVVSLEDMLLFLPPPFKAYFTRPDGGELYVSRRELKTPAGTFKGQGWYLSTLPSQPEFSRFKPLSEGTHAGVIVFKPARAYDPALIAFLHPPSEDSSPRACAGSSAARAFPLTAEVSILQEGRVIVLGEPYAACLVLPERDA